MPGMPDDAGQSEYLDLLTTKINTLPHNYRNKLGNQGGSGRELISHWITQDNWIRRGPARKHVLEHWLNRPNSSGRRRGWWRNNDSDDTFDRVMTEALLQTLNLRYYSFDGVERDTPLETDRLWFCAGHTCKIVVWVAGKANPPKLIVLYMTPPSPDKLDSYMAYRRQIRFPQTADDAQTQYARLGKNPGMGRPPHPRKTKGNPEPFVIVTDVHNKPDPRVLDFVDLKSNQVADVIAFRPYRRSDELTHPDIYP